VEVKKRLQEINSLTHNISELHRAISNRDTDIAALQRNSDDLVKLNQIKQEQIDDLRNSIYKLQANVQNLTESSQRRQSQISSLQNQLSQLIQEKSNLQNELRDINQYARKKDLEIVELEKNKSHLQYQKLNLEQNYQELYDHYQGQEHEITALKKTLEELNKANKAQRHDSINTRLPSDIKIIETKKKISEEQWKNISNKSDYQRVKGHLRPTTGKWINPYCRRSRKRRNCSDS
jgi:chromosome segregation ATPase